MQFCQQHWDQLRDALRERDLYKYVSANGMDLVTRMSKLQDPEQGVTLDNYDPLMVCHNNLISYMAGARGIEILFLEGCPLCFCDAEHTDKCEQPDCPIGKQEGALAEYLINWASDHAAQDVATMLAGGDPEDRP